MLLILLILYYMKQVILYAFDYDQISGKQIIVRNAENGEEFETLDSKLIKLNNSDLVICDVINLYV